MVQYLLTCLFTGSDERVKMCPNGSHCEVSYQGHYFWGYFCGGDSSNTFDAGKYHEHTDDRALYYGSPDECHRQNARGCEAWGF